MMPFPALLTLYPVQDIYCFIHWAWRFRFLASQVKSVDIEEFFKGFLITSGSTTGRWYSTSMQGLLGNLQDGGLKARFQALARPCQTSPPSGSWVFQISYYSPATGEEIESNSRGMRGPPPLGLNIDRCIKLEKNTKRKIIKLNIFYLVEKIVRFHVDCR